VKISNHPFSTEVRNVWSYIAIAILVLHIPRLLNWIKSRDSSVSIALGYELDDRGSKVRFPVGARNFSLHHRVQNGSGAHPASYSMGIRGFFLGGKAAGREGDLSPPSSAEVKSAWSYTSTPQ
jgi:hypothetical protein